MKEQESQLIHSFNIAQTEEIRLRLRRYQGCLYADIRVWFTQDGGKEFFPTKRGICLPVEHLQEIEKGIRNAHILCMQLATLESETDGEEKEKPFTRAQKPFRKGGNSALKTP